MYKTTKFPAVIHEFKIRSLALREERMIRVFANRILIPVGTKIMKTWSGKDD